MVFSNSTTTFKTDQSNGEQAIYVKGKSDFWNLATSWCIVRHEDQQTATCRLSRQQIIVLLSS
jgi:hypothetical protein